MGEELAAWLRQQLENQRHTARTLRAFAAAESTPEGQAFLRGVADHLADDADAKQRILDRHVLKPGERQRICAECGGRDWKPEGGVLAPFPWVMPWPCPTIRLLALPHAGQPGYREEWRPQ